VKPERPKESDLLAIVQSGLQEQLARDRNPLPRSPGSGTSSQGIPESSSCLPMVRITLSIPEDLRYRLKLAMMDHRRTHRKRITQDEFCAQAIAEKLDAEENARCRGTAESALAAFLKECLEAGGLDQDWTPRAEALLRTAPAAGSY